MNILFVCTGNTCRSCMAEAIAKKEARDKKLDIKISSAGIYAALGQGASANAIEAMREMDIDLSCHISTPINEEILNKSDLILTMTLSHKMTLLSKYPSIEGKTHTLMGYIGERGEIDDPFRGDIIVYRRSAAQINGAVKKLFLKLIES